MKIFMAIVMLGAMAAGCSSVGNQVSVRPLDGRSASQIAQDEAQCESYAKGFPKDRMDHYAACMIARSYIANASLDESSLTVAIAQTRPHEPGVVTADLSFCDAKADKARRPIA